MGDALLSAGRAVVTKAGWLAALACLLLVTGVGCAGAAALPMRPAPAKLGDLNRVRALLGLRPLAENPAAAEIVADIARRADGDRPPLLLDSQPACVACELVFEDGRGVHPRELYAGRGGRGPIAFGLWRRDWDVATNLSVFFPTTALVLDPRARSFAAASTPTGMLLVAVTVDPRARFTKPVRWPIGAMDPRRQLWTELVLPPGTHGESRLLERRGSKWAVAAHPLADIAGLAGSRLVAFGLSSELAYGRRYAVGAGSQTVPLRTRAIPFDFRRRTWTFALTTPRERRVFLTVVRQAPPLLRRILAEIDGDVTVVGRGAGCSIADACEHEEQGKVTLSFRRFERFVIAHEIGHAVFDLALDETARWAVIDELERAGWKDRCCMPVAEIFADQLAFWALGGVPRHVDSYSDRMFLSRGRFGAFLRESASYRPLSTVGPLAR